MVRYESYAIQHKKTKKFVYATDFSMAIPIQRTSYNKAALWSDRELAEIDKKARKCGNLYQIVKIKMEVVADG